MASVRIIDVRKIVNPGGPRLGQIDTLVTYQSEDGNNFMVSVEKADPTDAEIQAAIKKDMESRSRLVGRTLTV